VTGAVVTTPAPLSARAPIRLLVRLLPLLTAAAVFGVGASMIDGSAVGALRDDSMYLELAKALAGGQGYQWLNLPGAPAATHFPPGYPAVLALLWKIAPVFPANVVLFKLANTLFTTLSAVCVARFVKRRFEMSEVAASLFALAAVLAVPVLTLATQVMSEPLFLLALLTTLFVAEDVLDDPEVRWPRLVALGLLAGATTLVRTNGVALLPALVLALCLRRRFRSAALFGLVMLALLLPWQLWVAAHAELVPAPMRGNYGSYAALLADAVRARGVSFLAAVAARTSREIATMLQYVVAPGASTPVRVTALVFSTALASLGIRPLWRRAPATALCLASYGAIVLFWPYTPARFLWCVWPLLLLLPVLGARELSAWAPQRRGQRLTRLAALGGAAALAMGYSTFDFISFRNGSWSASGYAERLRPLLVYVATKTPRDAVVATEAENTVYLYTGHRTVPVGSFMATDYLQPRASAGFADAMAVVLDRYRPAAVVVSTSFLRAAATELAARRPPLLAVVDSFPGGGLVLVPTRR
jgi:Dolichyl-phosphate-mannose-protein mannosyltransferase